MVDQMWVKLTLVGDVSVLYRHTFKTDIRVPLRTNFVQSCGLFPFTLKYANLFSCSTLITRLVIEQHRAVQNSMYCSPVSKSSGTVTHRGGPSSIRMVWFFSRWLQIMAAILLKPFESRTFVSGFKQNGGQSRPFHRNDP